MEIRLLGTCILLLAASGCAGWALRVPTRAEQAAEAARGLPEPDLSAAPFDEAAGLSPADRLFERHLGSVGGRKAIEGHTSARIIAQGTLLPGGDRVDVEERRKAPDQRLVLVEVHGVGSAAHGFDGRTAWATSTQYGGARYGPEETWRQRRIATFQGIQNTSIHVLRFLVVRKVLVVPQEVRTRKQAQLPVPRLERLGCVWWEEVNDVFALVDCGVRYHMAQLKGELQR